MLMDATTKANAQQTKNYMNDRSIAYSQQNVINFGDVILEVPRLKHSRPMLKMAFWVTRFWHDSLKSDQSFREKFRMPNDTFKNFDVTFYENRLLRLIKGAMDMDLVKNLFPRWKEVLQLRDGFSFGEIALLKKIARQATIYCTSDTEFAVITKKGDGDFDY
jgi:CRP-like cAMP-binding protein